MRAQTGQRWRRGARGPPTSPPSEPLSHGTLGAGSLRAPDHFRTGGSGMDQATLARIFEPFSSPPRRSAGAPGLGLSLGIPRFVTDRGPAQSMFRSALEQGKHVYHLPGPAPGRGRAQVAAGEAAAAAAASRQRRAGYCSSRDEAEFARHGTAEVLTPGSATKPASFSR